MPINLSYCTLIPAVYTLDPNPEAEFVSFISRNSEGSSLSAEELSSVPRDHGGAQGLPVRHDQAVQ